MAKVTARGSQFAEALLEHKGNPVEFGDLYEPQKMIYDLYPDFLVLKAGRQVGKSIGLAGRINIGSVSQRNFTSLYTAPSQIQSKRFSTGYIDDFREGRYIEKHFINKKATGNVFEKHYTNKSKVYVSYAQTEADSDRVRGMTADLWCADEVQDMEMRAIPIIKEILNTSEFGYQIFAGTSKSSANTLEQLWLETNQCEFVKKCSHCGKWVIPNEFDTMMEMCTNPNHMVCPHCHKEFSFYGGQWVASVQEKGRGVSPKFGLHLPQLIFGANTNPDRRQWRDLFGKIQQSLTGTLYTADTVANEIFGLATDLGATSLGISEAQACCMKEYDTWPGNDWDNLNPKVQTLLRSIRSTVMGVDWSVSGSEGSFTVVTVYGIDHTGRMILVFAKKLMGSHILKQVDEVLDIANKYNCAMIGSDRGVGVLQGELMQQRYGYNRVIMCQYTASEEERYWNTKGKFLGANRTKAMDEIMHKMRLGQDRFVTPTWSLTEGYWSDAVSIYEEETRIGRRIYQKQPSVPDDWFHSTVFANLAHKFLTGDYTHLDHYDGE